MLRAMANGFTAEARPRVALVVCGDDGVGAQIALSLAAKKISVVLVGANERRVAETVGEIAFGGGKARHVAGDPSDGAVLQNAAARAREVFGGLDFVVQAAASSDAIFALAST